MMQALGVDNGHRDGPALSVGLRVVQRELDWPMLIFAIVVSAATLFAYQLNSLTVVVDVFAMVLLCIYRPAVLPQAMKGSWLLPLFMGWTLLSTFWSDYPGTCLYYGVQSALTLMIGMQLGHGSRRDEALLGLFFGWSIYTLSSLMFGHSVKWGAHGASAFSGLNSGKNYAGDTAALGFIFALHAIRWGLACGRVGVTAYAAIVALADVYIVTIAQSSGAILGVGQSILLFLILSLLMLLSLKTRVSLLLITFLSAAILFLARDIWLEPLRDGVLAFFGKDPTLTGRLYLWVRAEEIIQSHPWLGVGYNSFWVQGNLDAEGLWRSEGIIGRTGFNFHNSLIEMKVHLGWIGVVLSGTVLAVYSLRLLKGFALYPDITRMTWLIVLLYEFGRMPYESIGISPFSYTTMVLVGALTAGALRKSQRQAFRPQA